MKFFKFILSEKDAGGKKPFLEYITAENAEDTGIRI